MDILVLDSTSKSLRTVLGEAIATNQVDFTVHYADATASSLVEGNSVAVSNGITNVEISPAPAASTRRVIRNITAYNADTTSHIVSIMVRDTATDYLFLKVTLGAGASWAFGEPSNAIGESVIAFYQDSTASTSLYGNISGSVDGSNAVFTVSKGSYISGTLTVYLNGQQLTPGGSNDWNETTPSGGTFTLVTAPVSGDVVSVTYQKILSAMSSGDADLLDGQHGSYYMTAVAPSTAGNLLTSNGTIWTSATPPLERFVCNGRLTLESGVPISTTDQVDKTTLYFTPYQGNQISLYSGTAWSTVTFSELSLNIVAYTASKPYDIWVYNNAGTATLDSTVWTDATTRATALALQDGVYVKTGDTTRRYLGTIYMDAASKCQDKLTKRFVWNYYNRVPRKLKVIDATDTWDYTTATWRSANNSTANRVETVIGVSENKIDLSVTSQYYATSLDYKAVSIGINSTSAKSTDINNSVQTPANQYGMAFAYLAYYPAVGYSYYQWIEISYASGTTTWYGTSTNERMSGMLGEVIG